MADLRREFWGVPAHLGAQKAGVGLPDTEEPIVELFGADTAQLLAWTKSFGTVRLKLPSGSGRDRVLQYDAHQLEATIEVIRLSDAGLKSSWGEKVYRILLSSTKPVSTGKWSYYFGAGEL